MDFAQPVLSDEADDNEDEFTLNSGPAAELGSTLVLLGSILASGWTFRACWIGDEIKYGLDCTAHHLAGLAQRSEINRYTLYTVE